MSNVNYYKRFLKLAEENQSKELVCIPSPFERLSTYWPGIEHGTYNIITASSGVGKSQFTDFLFMHHPVKLAYDNPDKFRLKIIYYSLEMNPVLKAAQCLAHKIHQDTGERLGIKNMMSVTKKLSSDGMDLMKGYDDYFDWFYKTVDLRRGPVYPDTLYNEMYHFYSKHGKIHTKPGINVRFDKAAERMVELPDKRVFDYYEPNDKELFIILILDHAALVKRPKGLGKRETMEATSENLMELRNDFGLIIASINQQAADQEAKDNYKRPTLSGLGDNKALQRDAEIIFGLYDPNRQKDRKANGYVPGRLNNRYRELLLMKDRYGPSSITTDMFYDGTIEMFYEMPDAVTKYENATDQKRVDDAIKGWYEYANTLPIVL